MHVPHMNAREYTLLIGGIENGIPKCLFPYNAKEYTCLIGGIEKGIPKACSPYECKRVHPLNRGN